MSRCLQFNLKRLSVEQLQEQLARILAAEQIFAEPGAVALLARAADGSVRDALSLLDQALAYTGGALTAQETATMLGTVGPEQVVPLIEALAAGDGRALLRVGRELAEFSPDFNQILGETLSTLRRIAVVQTLGEDAKILDESDAIIALAASMAPEDCHLFYQLGLLARRDLPLAPEPQIGFEMALLRMLAFRPQTTDDANATRAIPTMPKPAAPPVKPPRAAIAPVESKIKPAPEIERAADVPASVTTDETLDWAATVAKLETTGLIRELAKNCALRSFDGRVIDLVITPQFENLRGERQVQGLEQALAKQLQRPIVVRLSVARSPIVATPAQQLSAVEAARQAAAQHEIADDPNVQVLQREFGATIERVTTQETSKQSVVDGAEPEQQKV